MTKLIDITGKALSGEWGTDDLDGTGIRVLRTTNFTNDGVVDYNDVVTRKIAKKNLDSKYLRHGDIIIEKSGGSDKQPVGRVIYFEGPEQTYLFNNFTGLLRVHDRSTWLPRYVFYSLFSNYLMGGTRAYENRTTGLHNLQTDSYISSFEVRPVSIEKQVEICSTLDKIIHMISLKKKQISKLDELVKSRFVEMFENDRFPYTTIGNLVERKVGAAKKDFASTDTIKYIDISSIDNKRNMMTGYTEYILADAPSRAQQHICKGDIVVSTVRPNLKNVASTPFDDDNLVASSGFCVLRPRKCLPPYLMAVVCSDEFTKAMTNVVTGANYPAIKDSDVMSYPVRQPPMDLQQEFSAFVAEVDKSKLSYEMEVAA